jgi:D-alanine--poly(phosphoribitol) ligase subunit 1
MKFCFETRKFIEVDYESDKFAVIGENISLSWNEFKTAVEYVSDFLTSDTELIRELPVIIYGHKNAEMVVAIYACMHARIPYIPIDEVYPRNRLERIAEISGAQRIINCSGKERVDVNGVTEIVYSHDEPLMIEKKDFVPNPVKFLSVTDPLVYIIFTSGSTGEPKGVQISNEAILSFTRWMTSDFGFKSNDVFANIAVFSFDLSVFELMTFGALGSTLLLNGKNTLQKPDEFLLRLANYKASVWVSTPSFCLMYARETFAEIEKNIAVFLFCGEVLPHALAASLKQLYPNSKVFNTYGPTEATVATSLVEIDADILVKYPLLPVGFPKRECEITIEENEIVIHGPHVSLGYLNRPDLNEVKFGLRDNTRFFKTGDLGYLEDGMLFCRGRKDDQIKLRGFRIELNEITAKIDALSFIEKSATIALKRNEEVKKIVALVTLKDEVDFDVKAAVFQSLKASLPEYMIPSDIKVIDEIPLNQNGKADRNQLTEIYLKR